MADTTLQSLTKAQTTREWKGRNVIRFPENYCVIDTETTGLSPDWDHLIEVAAVRFSGGKEAARFSSLIQPPRNWAGAFVDEFIADLTGITNEMLETAPQPTEVLSELASFIGETTVVGHYVIFDIHFLYDSFVRYLGRPFPNDYVDTLRFSRKLHPEISRHRLADVVKKYGIVHNGAHRALGDVEATAACYDMLKAEALERYGSEEEFQKAFRRGRNGSRSGKSHSVKASDIQGHALTIDKDSPIYECACVFTGKLEKLTRREAMQIVADLGGINQDAVTKKTRYLILGNNDYCTTIKDGKSRKQKKAEAYALAGTGIEILPETVFYDMLGDELLEDC